MKRLNFLFVSAAVFAAALFFPLNGSCAGKAPSKHRGDIRILYWNIQMGMWADQEAEYANFRKWIKEYKPDICVWCESGSYKKTSGKGSIPKDERYFPAGWKEFAASYGHKYMGISAVRDNFPQVITSRFPLSTVEVFDSTGTPRPIWHGAGHHRIKMKGRVIDVVTCHPWPFSYSFEARKTPAQKESSAKKEGDEYRAFEMWYIVDHTICNPEYAGAEWILVGDMNSISRVDNHRYNLPEDSSQFLTQDVIRTRTDLVDVIGARNPGEFVSSTAKGTRRIDYIYLSPSLDARVRSASIIKETWVPVKYTGISNYWIPSDHLPIVVDLKL